MKRLFVCEKCGKFFDTYEEANKHDYFHYSPEVDQWDTKTGKFLGLDQQVTYKEGEAEPATIHIRMTRYNPETGNREFRFGKYRLVSSYAAPLVITDDETAANKE